jgi:TadE-like protein
MRKLIRKTRTKGQALVEFALASTLIFFLLGAAIDLGLIFFTFQELRVAAQEGATYGSYPVIVENADGSVNRIDLRYENIVDRVRFSAGNGDTNASGFANLLDLNGDGAEDGDDLFGGGDGRDENGFVYIQNLLDVDNSGDPSNDGAVECRTNVARVEMRNAGRGCFIRVTVRYNYRMLFPLLPAFANTVPLRVSYILKIRSSFIG